MNDLNALLFAVIGLVMEALPAAFPGWFPPSHADQSSTRALWLEVMGAVQVALGAGYALNAHLLPMMARLSARLLPAGTTAAEIAPARAIAVR